VHHPHLRWSVVFDGNYRTVGCQMRARFGSFVSYLCNLWKAKVVVAPRIEVVLESDVAERGSEVSVFAPGLQHPFSGKAVSVARTLYDISRPDRHLQPRL